MLLKKIIVLLFPCNAAVTDSNNSVDKCVQERISESKNIISAFKFNGSRHGQTTEEKSTERAQYTLNSASYAQISSIYTCIFFPTILISEIEDTMVI